MGEDGSASEWTVVTKADKKRIARRSTNKGSLRSSHLDGRRTASNDAALSRGPFTTKSEGTDKSTSGYDESVIVDQIRHFQRDFVRTDLYRAVCLELDNNYRMQTFETIVCYGIGAFSRPRSGPMWQLVLTLCLRDHVMEKQQAGHGVSSKGLEMFFYDPCTTHLEASILRGHFDVKVLDTNERGRRPVNGRPTLFFMPHCPRKLYENVVLANWGEALERVILVGNSLPSYETRRQLDQPLPECLRRILPHVIEVPLVASKMDLQSTEGYFEEAFNDLFITSFTKSVDCNWPTKPDEDESPCGELL